jgi:hypothetical protein
VEDWGKLLGDGAAVTAMLDRLLHHGHILKCGPRSWRTKTNLPTRRKRDKKASRPGPSHMAGFEVTTEAYRRVFQLGNCRFYLMCPYKLLSFVVIPSRL